VPLSSPADASCANTELGLAPDDDRLSLGKRTTRLPRFHRASPSTALDKLGVI